MQQMLHRHIAISIAEVGTAFNCYPFFLWQFLFSVTKYMTCFHCQLSSVITLLCRHINNLYALVPVCLLADACEDHFGICVPDFQQGIDLTFKGIGSVYVAGYLNV